MSVTEAKLAGLSSSIERVCQALAEKLNTMSEELMKRIDEVPSEELAEWYQTLAKDERKSVEFMRGMGKQLFKIQKKIE